VQAEEGVLFAICHHAAPVNGGAVGLFASPHRKTVRLLARFRPELEALHEPVPKVERRILRPLVTEAIFRDLMEHHDLREANTPYPTLDRVTSETKRRELLDAVARST
jgi:hypothetical protein